MIDIHSHILPAIDDGAKNTAESRKLLEQLKSQNVTAVVATPHFYPSRTVLEDFIETRAAAAKEIREACEECGIELFLGAEVLYFGGIGTFEDMKKLAFSNSGHILIELLGLKKIDDKVIGDIVKLRDGLGLIPVIAHVERYSRYKGYKKLLTLFENGTALCQINASFYLSGAQVRTVRRLLRKGLVHFIASDCHSSVNRPVNLEKGIAALKLLSVSGTKKVLSNCENLYGELTDCYDK